MSAGRIKNAALLRFAAQGYDATSLAEIAGDVGIKTPSIYAHFSGKLALFRQLVELACERELDEIRKSLQRPMPIQAAMREYLYGTIERFQREPHLRFWLRSIYLPPAQMHEEISARDREFAVSLETVVSGALRHPEFGLRNPALPHETLAIGFIGTLRSIHAELLYCSGSDSTKALNAMWTIFALALAEKPAAA